MFGIGTPELLVILAVALIVIGPKKLPDLAKSLGRALGEFKRATNDLKHSIEQESGLDEVKTHFKEVKQDVLTAAIPDSAPPKKPVPPEKGHSEIPPTSDALEQPTAKVDDLASQSQRSQSDEEQGNLSDTGSDKGDQEKTAP